MDRRELPPTLKNKVLEALQAQGLDPSEFQWLIVKGPWAHLQVSQLIHHRTGFFFVFDMSSGGGYHPQAWPGGDLGEMHSARMMDLAQRWVIEIAPEIKAPDLWQLAADQPRIGTDPGSANTPFTQAEQLGVGRSLFRLEEFVYQSEPSLEPGKRQAVVARFAYLKDAATRLGRIDWMTLVVGQFFSMASERIITVQTFHGLYSLAGDLLRQIVTLGTGIADTLLGA
jgi:hypothetical protein